MPSIKFKQDLSAEEAAEAISDLALGLATGDLKLESGVKSREFHPSRDVKMEIKSSENEKGGKLTIEVEWKSALRISG